MTDSTQLPLRIPVRADADAEGKKARPALLQSAVRGGGSIADPFLDQVIVESVTYELAAVGRGEAGQARALDAKDKVLALEAVDGSTVFIHADRLREDLARLYPEALQDGQIDLTRFRDRDAATRGGVDWIWSKLSEITLGSDSILEAARQQALKWIEEWLGEKIQDAAEAGASWLGAKALMWAIESRLAGEPGLYQWRGTELVSADRCDKDDPRLTQAASQGPILLFIHGTASSTLGSFLDLRSPGASTDWAPLATKFAERVFGFEHRTFSESPIDNALALAQLLPAKARICLVTHSRGGLVGDLFCTGTLTEELIGAYRRDAPVNTIENTWQRRVREQVAASEQDKLRQLRKLLDEKGFQIERYVRVASPARGTTLLSDNLDVFLSGLLSLMAKLAGSFAGPAVGAALSAFKRIVLEIAHKRVQPQLVPGIEAMLSDAPMGVLLARAPRRQGIQMAVVSGDIEGGGILQRIGVMFTDWMFFDRANNDLVVDTASMYAGLAHPNDTRYLFDQGEAVNHFSYFDNRISRTAVRDWLTVDEPANIAAFSLIEVDREPTSLEAQGKASKRGVTRAAVKADTRPVVILLPGIMGSHLTKGQGDRVWFDLLDLATGGLDKIRYGAADVQPEVLFDMFYGELADYLAATHTVIPFPYDWRRPIQDVAEQLAEMVRETLKEHAHQPLRFLAHSMGGLLVRAMIARHPDLWDAIVARPGSQFVMLGTPNHGSHRMVETLFGKADTVRNLARVDLRHDLGQVLEIIAGFPGAVQLLPRPGFRDNGQDQAEDYFDRARWEHYRAHNKDRWFGDGLAGIPDVDTFKSARALWDAVLPSSQEGSQTTYRIPNPERVTYVFGQADNTPCGIRIEGGQLKMVGTSEGDGSVSWASGRLASLPDERYWHMPVKHGNLANTEAYFPAIVELLQTGHTGALGRLPASRGTGALRLYDAGPTPYPSDEELTRSLVGAAPPRRKKSATLRRLAVKVKAMDLRYMQLPILCGHYQGDPIAGAQAHIDRHVVDGALSRREHLGIYADIGTSAVVLNARSQEDLRRGSGKGAVIVGLGKFGELTVGKISETVRAGVLRLLLHTLDCKAEGVDVATAPEPREIGLASLLIGYNSTANISVEDSVGAIVRGVCEGNRQFEDAMGPQVRVGKLEFIELYRDSAISAAHAVRALARRLDRDLRRLNVVIDAADQLEQGDGVRERLAVLSPFGYWPRLIVSDADRTEEACPPECYRSRRVSPIPEEVVRELVDEELRRRAAHRLADAAADSAHQEPDVLMGPARTALAQRLKYVFLSERARAEAIVHQRQPGLIEALIKDAIALDRTNAELSHTLFQLMVPLDFKAAARDTDRLVLVVDSYTANLPWEMLQADDEPLVRRTRMVRQLVSAQYRRAPHTTPCKAACVIVDPSTQGYVEHFGKAGVQPLPNLDSAVAEGQVVRELLAAKHYDVEFIPSGSDALTVISGLYKRPYRILTIAAHGEFELMGRDGVARSGVVLSGGVVLTAAEVSQMEVVPDVVFLNCCHLGKIDAAHGYNKLAYSLARELIEMGVRCVIAAGWAVNDQAARTFAQSFFTALVTENRPFGEAVYSARQAAYEKHPGCNTWGAYQAYGDPLFQLEHGGDGPSSLPPSPTAPEELVTELNRLRLAACHDPKNRDLKRTQHDVQARLDSAPRGWSDLPQIQFALGALYGEFGKEGYAPARAAYERAIAADDNAGRLPAKAIEQLANLEAREGEQTKGAEGMALIDRAIERLKGLIACTQEVSLAHGAESIPEGDRRQRMNVERWSMLGSAWKRKASRLAESQNVQWSDIEIALERSRNAYLTASSEAAGDDFSPYPVLNRLQLDGILGDTDPAMVARALALARRCADIARRRFATSYDFFDAVMAADAELAIRMIEGTLSRAADDLIKSYRDAISGVPASARQCDSVIQQLQLLSSFFRLRAGEGDKDNAGLLNQLAQAVADSCRAGATAPDRLPMPKAAADAAPGAQVEADRPVQRPATSPRPARRARAKGSEKK